MIGEAGKQVSQETRNGLADLPWSQMARTRDLLIHSYAKVDLVEVFLTVQRDLPVLIATLKDLGIDDPSGPESP